LTQPSSPTKPFKSYSELSELLIQRNLLVEDRARAERKLAQIGYYRLSGFWYPCRKLRLDQNGQPIISAINKPERLDDFEDGTSFNAIFELYLFDKKLRQLMLDAIERIEVHVRAVIAHEIGRDDPLAYQVPKFINPKQTRNFQDKKTGKQRNIWNEWFAHQPEKVNRSHNSSDRF
jgi:abortive infection bacteriophage resistance protein